MKRYILICMAFLLVVLQQSYGQKKWNLGDCITYAVSNNLGLQRQRLLTENSRVYLAKSRMDLLPSLNIQSDGRIGFGRSIDPVTNLITFKQNISNSYSISSNLDLFTGFATLNTISANSFMLKAGIEAEKVAVNTLVVEILGAYYQVLYARGLEQAAKIQLELSEKQLFRLTRTVEIGREALSRQYELESKVSQDRLSYTVAVNTSNQALTKLRQILQLEPDSDFDILTPEMPDLLVTDKAFRTDSIFEIASQTLPRLRAIDYELSASRKELAAARGGLSPTLSVGGAIFTGYYRVISEGAGEQDSYSDQLKNNNSQAIFATLRIPIFNNYITGRNIRLARIRMNDTELKLYQERNSLFTEIENACLEYNRGKDEFAAASANYEFNRKSFDAVEKKFEAGLVDVTDYSAASTSLFRAETETIRTRLQLLIRRLTIEFYTTGDYRKIISI